MDRNDPIEGALSQAGTPLLMPSLLDINPLIGGICHRGGINSPQGTKANKWKKIDLADYWFEASKRGA